LDISILSKGQTPKIPEVMNTDEIEGNLFLPDGVTTERERIHFVLDLYRGMDFVKKNSTQEGGTKRADPPTSHIQISFSGVDVSRTRLFDFYHP
jgi:hypothetical protein